MGPQGLMGAKGVDHMFVRLLLLFSLVPLIELYFLLWIGSMIGAANTIFLVLATGFLGAYLAQKEGIRAFQRIQAELGDGRMPGDSLLDAVLILMAGLLLITPGILTDLLGFSLLFPFSRMHIRRMIRMYIERKVFPQRITVYPQDPHQ